MGIKGKRGIALIEVIVSIAIAATVLSIASSTLPRIFNQLKNDNKIERVQDYIRIMSDFRNADIDSTVSKDVFILKIDQTTIYYKNKPDGVFREQGKIIDKMFFDKITIERQPKKDSKTWKLREQPAKILFYNWWKVNLHKNNVVISGILKGK